jgi:Tol biopolymer transport system component
VLFRALEPGFESEGWQPTGLARLGVGVFGADSELSSDTSDQNPQSSPDGRMVVFSRGVDPGPQGFPTASAIFLMHRDGTGLRRLAESGPASRGAEPAFSASGREVLFTYRGDLYSFGLGQPTLRRITSGPASDRSPAASPGGRQIVFSRTAGGAGAGHIFSIRPNGSSLRDLTPGLAPQAAASDPDFSPDGRVIAFAIGDRSQSDVFTIRANGARLQRLTGRRRGPVLHGYSYGEPVFSPAGGSLFAVAVNAYNIDLARIVLRDPDSPHRLLAGEQPVWAPAPRGRR